MIFYTWRGYTVLSVNVGRTVSDSVKIVLSVSAVFLQSAKERCLFIIFLCTLLYYVAEIGS
jgi:hypothetical protein